MALPSSGTISMDMIRAELGVPSQSPFSLDTARAGGYVALNTLSPTTPPAMGTISLADWYGYCQTCQTYSFSYATTEGVACINNDPITIISSTIPIGVGSLLYLGDGSQAFIDYYYSDGTNWYYAEMNVSEQTEVTSTGSCITTSTTTTTTTGAPVPYTIDNAATGSSASACAGSTTTSTVYAIAGYTTPIVGMIFYDSPSLTTPFVGSSGWRKLTNGVTDYAAEVDTNGELTNYVTC
jgi:hypothetical protein